MSKKERRPLTTAKDLYEQWEQRMREEGRQEARRESFREGYHEARQQTLLAMYEARFGSAPAELRAALEKAAAASEAFSHWIAVLATRPQQEIAALLSEESTPAVRRRPPTRRPKADARRR